MGSGLKEAAAQLGDEQNQEREHRGQSPGVGGPLRWGTVVLCLPLPADPQVISQPRGGRATETGLSGPVSASPCRPPGDLTAPGRPPEPRSGSRFPLPHHHYFQEVGMSLFPSCR